MDKPKGKPRGRNGGRPATVNASIRITITLDQSTLDTLKSIDANLSAAVRTLAARSQ